jgi:hypothetical protein
MAKDAIKGLKRQPFGQNVSPMPKNFEELTRAAVERQGPSKPIDRWLGLIGIVVGIICFLIPDKTRALVVFLLVVMFACLWHPVWAWWSWIAARRWRQMSAEVLLAVLVVGFGFVVWPYQKPDQTDKIVKGVTDRLTKELPKLLSSAPAPAVAASQPPQAPAVISPKNVLPPPVVSAKVDGPSSLKKVVREPRLPAQTTQPTPAALATPAALDGVSMVPRLPQGEAVFPMQFELHTNQEIRDVDVFMFVDFLVDKNGNIEGNTSTHVNQYIERVQPGGKLVVPLERSVQIGIGINSAAVETLLTFTIPGVVGRWSVSQEFSYTEDKQGRRRWDATTVRRGRGAP